MTNDDKPAVPNEGTGGETTIPSNASHPDGTTGKVGAPGSPSMGAPGLIRDITDTPAELPGFVDLPPEDQVRRDLAFFVLWIVVGVIAAGLGVLLASHWLKGDTEGLEHTVQLFFTAVITLASTVFGFYFATRSKQ